MGRSSSIPDLEAKIGGSLKDYLVKKIDSGVKPGEIAAELGIGTSACYEYINFYELKDSVKRARLAKLGQGSSELEERWDEYIREKEISHFSPSTIERSKMIKKLYIWWLKDGNRAMTIQMGLSKEYLTDFLHYISRETQRWGADKPQGAMSARSILSWRKGIAAFVNWLRKQEILEKDPLIAVPKPKMERRLPEDIPDEVIAKVLEGIGDKTFSEIRDRAIVYMFMDTGMRLGGVTGLIASQFNLETGWGKIKEKGSKERLIKLTPHLRAQLKKYMEIRGPIARVDSLWVNQDGSEYRKDAIGRMISRLNDLPGVREMIKVMAPGERIHPHLFRHIWAKHMAQADIPLQAIRQMGGWESIELVMFYANAYSGKKAWDHIDKASPLNTIVGAPEEEEETGEPPEVEDGGPPAEAPDDEEQEEEEVTK